MIGTSLLHFEIAAKLGEGGMGVVYKARDTHLDRFVAIKVLPPERVASEERKRRFIQEAKAASALNHPNIVHIYDIASDHDTTFIAMELVPGTTLADAIPRQGLPVGQALDHAVQIADALATAHQAGIVHRDLKPGNIMIGDDGRVRILDFGLAKLMEPSSGSDDDLTRSLDGDSVPITEEGRAVGTAAYMSPEQAEGRQVDSRSDIFSFGVVLYEMLSGRRPFGGDSVLATLSAVLKESPEPLSEAALGSPSELERLVDRCLRKDPDRRWQNMADLRVALLELKEESESGVLSAPSPGAAPEPAGKRWPWAAAAAIVLAASTAGWLWLQTRAPQPTARDLRPIPLTAFEGDEGYPAFSPDGNQIAFSWGPEGGVTNTYIKLVGPGDPIRLTNSPFAEAMQRWSPDGRWIAFTAFRDFGRVVVAVPALGGPERIVTDTWLRASWTPDSRFLVAPIGDSLYLVPLDGGERKLLTGPLEYRGTTHRPGAGTVSPDGRTLALTCTVGSQYPLFFVPLGDGYSIQGEPRLGTPEDWKMGNWSWTPDSRSVIAIRDISYSGSGGDSGMYRIAVSGGEPQRLDFAGDNPWYLDVASSGNRLAYTRLRRDVNLYRTELEPDGTLRGDGTLIAASSRRETMPVYSPDGSRIAFSSNRSGSDEIWIADRNGENLVQLTHSANPDGTYYPQWSPDGTQIVYRARPAGAIALEILVISATGGAPRRLTDDSAVDETPSWSRDGDWIYFSSDRGGQRALWKIPSTGGEASRAGPIGSAGRAVESADGRWIYLFDRTTIARFPASGGEPEPLMKEPLHPHTGYGGDTAVLTDRGIYYLTSSQDSQSATLNLLPLEGGEPRVLGTISGTISWGLSVAPDHSSILFSQCDQCAADIMLVENFQ